MESSEVPTNQLLKNKYRLDESPEVKTAAARTKLHTGEWPARDPLARIQNYLNRFHEIVDQKNPQRGEHALDLIKGRFHAKYVIKPNEIPEAYFDNQRRLAREQGHGDIEITPETRSQLTEVIIADQRSSLDKWMDYLSSSDAPYSDALKYFTLRSVLNMAEYDKERKMYPQRSKGTTKPFPDLNREALAYVLDAVDKKYKGQNINISSLDAKDATEFENLLKGENFAKLYAWAIEKVTPASQEELSATKGGWVKYHKDSDPTPLVQSLQGHGTGWCTAGESTARIQLRGGDFYVYYSHDKAGKLTIPRAAIRMEGNRIAEVRGIAPEQNLDSGAVTVVEEKLKSFPDSPSYQKKISDMRRLTNIENQMKKGQQPTGEDLYFLYEIDSPIEGFGFDKDPRIEEIRSQRNPEEDMPIIFGCSRDQIAATIDEIRPDTKVYIGSLETGISDKLKGVEHIYTSFPEGKIRIEDLAIGGRPKEQLREDLKHGDIQVSSYAEDEIKHSDFTTLPTSEVIKTVRLRVQDLGFKNGATTAEIIGTENDVDEYGKPAPFTKGRMTQLGLDLCFPEVGVYQRLKDANQTIGEWYYIAMKPIAARDGDPFVFDLGRYEDGLWLDGHWAEPGRGWAPKDQFVFSLRKSETQNTQTPGLLDRIFRR